MLAYTEKNTYFLYLLQLAPSVSSDDTFPVFGEGLRFVFFLFDLNQQEQLFCMSHFSILWFDSYKNNKNYDFFLP